ncbi:DUF3298 and DUF4163 domain-containing protein [Dyadobacter sp. CY312]|uniref:DUF3298 and DUF4163 domain-containing protein n=1 Tax=Dyadobacter sp. CY312 TaxID=2907303 RepID=UPI001F2EC7A1|nr:DUF3298 and DUF4163 domain-containing protein [Dyadobacter sp. CY312]MCE7039698.1 DUF3298 and DUF4163 domain-containing protein [Dyadobacter sp. CY312]
MRLTNYILSALFTAFIACNPSEKKETSEKLVDLKNGKLLLQNFGTCDTVLSAGVYIKIATWLPSDSTAAAANIRTQLDKKLIDRINSYGDSASIASNPGAKTSTKSAFEVLHKNYTDFKKDFPDAPGCWFVELKGDTVMVTPKVLLYQLDHFSFMGGAHPNSFRSLHVFDAVTGEEKEAKTFIADSTALLKKVEAEFRKIEKLDASANLEESGYFLLNHKFFIPANYTFTKEGVLFYYNPYEIAAYARGAITFTIPYKELDGIVKTDLIF